MLYAMCFCLKNKPDILMFPYKGIHAQKLQRYGNTSVQLHLEAYV